MYTQENNPSQKDSKHLTSNISCISQEVYGIKTKETNSVMCKQTNSSLYYPKNKKTSFQIQKLLCHLHQYFST